MQITATRHLKYIAIKEGITRDLTPSPRQLQTASQEGQIFFDPKIHEKGAQDSFAPLMNPGLASPSLCKSFFAVVAACSPLPGSGEAAQAGTQGLGPVCQELICPATGAASCLRICLTQLSYLQPKYTAARRAAFGKPFPLWTFPADSACGSFSSPESPQLTPGAPSVTFSFGRTSWDLQPPPPRPLDPARCRASAELPTPRATRVQASGSRIPRPPLPQVHGGAHRPFEKKREWPSSGCCKAIFCLAQKPYGR